MKRKSRLRNSGIFLKEYLTIPQKLILDEAKEAQKHGILSQVFSKQGQIYGTEEFQGKAEKIHDLKKLQEFNREAAKKQKEVENGTNRALGTDASSTQSKPRDDSNKQK